MPRPASSAVETWKRHMVRLGFLIAASAALVAIPALADEPIYNWTGFYIGANAGGGWGKAGSNVVLDKPTHAGTAETPMGSASGAMNGALGGVQGGYVYQTHSF